MIDFIEMGRRLWESGAAEAADFAENHQPRAIEPESHLRVICGNCGYCPCVCGNPQNPQHIRNPKAAANTHRAGLSAKPAESAAANRADSENPGPLAEIDHIIAFLVEQVGRDLGAELARRVRHVMPPMSRKDRAELAAALDDAFEVAPNVGAARWQCHRLLSDSKALAEAQAAWPGLPQSVEDETHG